MSEQERRCCPCEHPGHPDRPSYSAPGTVLCAGHVAKILTVLSQLSTFDADADQAIHDQALSRHVGAPVSGDPEPPLPIDPRITEHRQQIGQVLASWCQLVAEERDITAPDLTSVQEPIVGPICAGCGHGSCRRIDRSWREVPRAALPALCAFLARHHGWSVEQPWADDYAAEILELGRRAWSLLNPSGRRRFTNRIMRCVEIDDVDGSRCPGNLWCFLTPDDPYAEAKSVLVCDECGHEVTSDKWMTYGRKVLAETKKENSEAAA